MSPNPYESPRSAYEASVSMTQAEETGPFAWIVFAVSLTIATLLATAVISTIGAGRIG